MTERTPSIEAVALGEWAESFRQWSFDSGRLVVWVEDAPPVDEGDAASLNYFGPSKGETATAFDVPIQTIEAAHGGFHVTFDVPLGFIEDVTELHPTDAQDGGRGY